ncbi:MAG: response regulator [Treponema sp.]|nr:response regulator [Treponema sp.]
MVGTETEYDMEDKELLSQIIAGDYSILENLPVGIGIYKVGPENLSLLYNNKEYYRVHYGSKDYWDSYDKEDAISRIIPEDRHVIYELWEEHIDETDYSLDVHYRCRTESGSVCWIRLIAHYVCQVGDDKLYYGVHLDFNKEIADENLANLYTERIEAHEKVLEQNYAAAQELLEHISGTAIASTRSDITHDVVELIGGESPLLPPQTQLGYEEMLDVISRIMPRRQDVENMDKIIGRQALLQAFAAGEKTRTFEYFFRPHGESVKLAHCTVNIMNRPGTDDVISFGTVTDVSNTMLINSVISQVLIRQYEFIAMIDAISNVLTFIQDRGDTSFFDEGKQCQSYDAWLDYCSDSWILPEEREHMLDLLSLMQVMVALKNDNQYDVLVKVNDGGEVYTKLLTFFYIDRECRLIGLTGQDYTKIQRETEENERKMRLALTAAKQASVAKSSFLSRMSHEIRTPLNAIIGMNELASQAIDEKTKLLDYINKMGISARYLLSLINDILDMSRIESGKLVLKNEPFVFKDFVAGINTIIQNQAQTKHLQYEYSVDDFVMQSICIGDKMKLQQCLINILGNAVKFTDSGFIRLDIECLTHTDQAMTIRCTMTDSGVGIPDEKKNRIFDPFEQVDNSNTSAHGGTGLGLAITKNLIEMMGGTIRLESTLGKGSSFIIVVPFKLADEKDVRTASLNKVTQSPLSAVSVAKINFWGKRFLLVEDNQINVEIAKSLLERKHALVEIAENGQRAVEKFTQSKPGTYQLILMDVRMPVMDGLAASKLIRSSGHPDAQKIPIIAMTANAFDDDVEKSRAAGMNAHLSKPIEPETMFGVVAHAIGLA